MCVVPVEKKVMQGMVNIALQVADCCGKCNKVIFISLT